MTTIDAITTKPSRAGERPENKDKEKTHMDKKQRKTGSDSALAQLRRERGMTQRELAARVGCYQKDISRWETGVRTPGAESLAKLAAALGCSSDDIIRGIIS